MLFRCTSAMQAMLGLRDADLAGADAGAAGDPTEWHCNTIHIDRRKCLLFTHTATLYSFVVAGVKKSDLRDFPELFYANLMASLAAEGFSFDHIRRFPISGPIAFAAAHDRSVLGSMNEFVHQCRAIVKMEGGLAATDIPFLNQRLNTMLMSAIGMESPIRVMTAMLEAAE